MRISKLIAEYSHLVFLSIAVLLATAPVSESYAATSCGRSVSDNKHILINTEEETRLKRIGLGREQVLQSLRFTSIPESKGCWASASGNFDGQLLSVGVAQWNFGQNSLQPLLRRFKSSYANELLFKSVMDEIMPQFGSSLFTDSCMSSRVGDKCKVFILSQQSNGSLYPQFRKEINDLFETDVMTQIQADIYVRMLGSVASDLHRLFPGIPTPLQVKWAVDTKVQQGKFPNDSDLQRVRTKLAKSNEEQLQQSLFGVVTWYKGLCMTIDSDGTRLDYEKNVDLWSEIIKQKKYDLNQAELLTFTFLRSRTATGKSGLYQANSFQRRAKIILGVGCVHGHCD